MSRFFAWLCSILRSTLHLVSPDEVIVPVGYLETCDEMVSLLRQHDRRALVDYGAVEALVRLIEEREVLAAIVAGESRTLGLEA